MTEDYIVDPDGGPVLLQVFWVNGPTAKGAKYQNTIKDPPCNGWQFAILIPNEKRSTLFCPFTFQGYTLPNDAHEITRSKLEDLDMRMHDIRIRMNENWTEFQTHGYERDYNTAAVVFKALGMDVPAQIMKGGEEDTREKGGKPVTEKLLKPVRRRGKRGDFLRYFLDNEGSRSIRECMAEFGMTRSNALSYLYTLNKDHGIGYSLVGDTATIELPSNVTEQNVWAGTLRDE